MGDKNCKLTAPHLDHNANLLSSIADVYSLQQLITVSTRCTDSSQTLIAWKNLFLFCVDKHAPSRNKRIHSCKSPWITSQQRLHARDILKLKATRSGDPGDWRKFKKLRNTVNNEIKRTKECYYYTSMTLVSPVVIHVTPGELSMSLCLGNHTVLL